MALVSCSTAGLRALRGVARGSTSLLASLCPRLASSRSSLSWLNHGFEGATSIKERTSLQVARFTSSEAAYAAEAGVAQPQPTQVYEVVLTGVVGRDIELRTMSNGRHVTTASLGVSVGKDQPTNWYDVSIFGELAESAASHLRKGSRIVVHGYLKQQFWSDKTTGAQRVKTGVIANNIGLLPRSDAVPADDYAAESGMQAAYVAQWPQDEQQHAATVDIPSEPRDEAEANWIEVVRNPTQWWDNRKNKKNPKQPDFKHKTNGTAVWLSSRGLPDWVPSKVNEVFGP